MSVDRLLDPEPSLPAIPIIAVQPADLQVRLEALAPTARAWAEASGFKAAAGAVLLIPDEAGGIGQVLFGLGKPGLTGRSPLAAGKLATTLPAGTYKFAGGFDDLGLATLAFALGAYRFGRYKAEAGGDAARLVMPETVDAADIRRMVNAVTLARNLINTPANDMGPADLAAAIRAVGESHGARVVEIVGEDLLINNFPMIHAVGAAADASRAPRLIDLTWGQAGNPKVTLVGKGVCFDTGGLDIKPSSNMLLMKKDMGGAANALALAELIMAAKLPVQLRLLVPAVENSISGPAFRPGDIFRARNGLSIEIGNTDAEGRLILADALALASEEKPELLFDFATLTGAARVALGPDLPAVFTDDETLAADVARHGELTGDPTWRLPLYGPYYSLIESKIADINNAGTGGYAGAITAALFLKRFVGEGLSWMHADLFAWTPSAKPGRPEGGEAQVIRGLYSMLRQRYPG